MLRLIISTVCIFLFHVSGHGQSLEKSIDKTAKKIWDVEFEVYPVDPDPVPVNYHDNDRFFMISKEGQKDTLGFCYATSAKGRYDEFDYFVLFNQDLEVLQVSVWLYRSTHGGAVAGKRWLSQFEGYSGEELRYGKDIQAISGATISGMAIVDDIGRVHNVFREIVQPE